MTRTRSIVLECIGYRGAASCKRCRAVEEHVMGCIEGECSIESVTMRELCVGANAIQPTVEVVYSKGDYRKMIPGIDEALLGIGLVATKALASTVVSHVASAMIAGAGAGGSAGGTAGRRSRGGGTATAAGLIARTLIGTAVGALSGKAAEKRTLGCIATKESGRWHIKRLPRQPS